MRTERILLSPPVLVKSPESSCSEIEDKKHEESETRIEEEDERCLTILVFPQVHAQQRISEHHRVDEPGQVGEAVRECGPNNHDPERVAQQIGVGNQQESRIFIMAITRHIPNHSHRERTIKQKVPTETDMRKFLSVVLAILTFGIN